LQHVTKVLEAVVDGVFVLSTHAETAITTYGGSQLGEIFIAFDIQLDRGGR
jgi:hypothetical protein